MATNRKIDDEDLAAANESDDPIQTLADRKEAKMAPKKAPIVTKEQLAKSGLSLRDYLNKQQGLTRRKDVADKAVTNATASRNTRSGPTADELDSYAKSKSAARAVAPEDQIPGKRGSTNEVDGGDSASGSELGRNVANTINALPGAAGLRMAAGAAKATGSASRALKPAYDEVTYLGKSGAKKMEDAAPRLKEAAKKITGGDDTAALAAPTKRISGPATEKVAEKVADPRAEVMDKAAWARGPNKAPKMSEADRLRILAEDTEMEGAAMKKGGKVKKFAAGGAIKGWGKARGARKAQYV